jgi:hypothetical protein
MRRGTRPTAAGSLTPGTSPILTHALPKYSPQSASLISGFLRTISNRHARKIACRAGCPLPSSRATTSINCSRPTQANSISNRHLVQLEITATPTKSTSSLFLIDPRRPQLRMRSTRFSSQPRLRANADRRATRLRSRHCLMPVPAGARIAVWERRFSARREEWL